MFAMFLRCLGYGYPFTHRRFDTGELLPSHVPTRPWRWYDPADLARDLARGSHYPAA